MVVAGDLNAEEYESAMRIIIGIFVLIGGAIFILIGIFWMQKIVKVDV